MITRFDGCTGCGACEAVCPVMAIKMEENEEGFLYPNANKEICMNCGKCDRVCSSRQAFRICSKKECYAVSYIQNKNKVFSSSGGVFAALAETILESGGYVCGAAYVKDCPSKVQHRIICDKTELPLLQGSKYVQSDAWIVFVAIRHILEEGKIVLFSGTPCQVAGLKSYLNKTYENLYTVEVICHGVPSEKIFRDYLKNSFGANVSEFAFRDKRFGWGYMATARMHSGKEAHIHRKASSYYDGYIRGYFLRKSCYLCSFANEERCADITIGDYWGVFQNHRKELLKDIKSWESGVSACIVNTDAGHLLFEATENKVKKLTTSFDQISAENYRLLHGNKIPDKREELMTQYRLVGYTGIEADFQKHRDSTLKTAVKEMLPGRIKFLLKCIK